MTLATCPDAFAPIQRIEFAAAEEIQKGVTKIS
jgi:hypothetical protein